MSVCPSVTLVSHAYEVEGRLSKIHVMKYMSYRMIERYVFLLLTPNIVVVIWLLV